MAVVRVHFRRYHSHLRRAVEVVVAVVARVRSRRRRFRCYYCCCSVVVEVVEVRMVEVLPEAQVRLRRFRFRRRCHWVVAVGVLPEVPAEFVHFHSHWRLRVALESVEGKGVPSDGRGSS